MKNYFHIKVLTPLHVGSGRTLSSNSDFLKFENVVSVIDEHKVLDIIGEENIQEWVNIISNGNDLLDYLKRRSPNKAIVPQQTHKRLLPIVGNYLKPENGLREQIFSGNGKALLPGSSLKGAIRTAVVNHLIKNSPAIAERALKSKKTGENRRGDKTVKYGKFETELIGKDPNHDSFRLVRIGDAHFDQTVCLLAQTLNTVGVNQEIKEKVNQLVECIPTGSEALCGVAIPADLLKEINKRPRIANEMIANAQVDDWDKIIRQINSFTKKQIEGELNKYTMSLPNEATAYPETLRELKVQMDNLSDNECIIRVGFGTGYLNMTGGWPIEQWKRNLTTQKYQEEMNDLGTAVRKNSSYNAFALPKSRKIISGGVPMGYLKLTLWSADEAELWMSKAVERQKEKEIQSAKEAEEAQRIAEQEAEAARIAEEEAKKPQMYEGPITKNLEVDAEVVVSARPNRVRIFVKGFDMKQYEMVDSAQQHQGYVCRVALVVEKGKILRVRHIKPK
jgi:CRISPR-associated protein Csm5